MLGAIIGDIVGSRFEFNNHRSKVFELFHPDCSFTDDTICTVAVAEALLDNYSFEEALRKWCSKYPNPMGGYGGMFGQWLRGYIKGPYNSFGNGSAMRVSPCGWLGYDNNEGISFQEELTFEEVIFNAECSAKVTHNHPEGIKGARCIADMIYRLRRGKRLPPLFDELFMRNHIQGIAENYGYDIDLDLHWLRDYNTFDETCQVTVPQAIACFLQSNDFEDCIRNAISIGGDSDTIAAIAGSLAEAHYGIPERFKEQALLYLPTDIKDVINRFYSRINTHTTWTHTTN